MDFGEGYAKRRGFGSNPCVNSRSFLGICLWGCVKARVLDLLDSC